MNIKQSTLFTTLLSVCFLSGSALANNPAATSTNDNTAATADDQGFMAETKQEAGDIGSIAWIKMKFAQDDLLSVFNISVSAEGNTVQLSGEVDTDLHYERALMIAHQAEGITTVNADELTVTKSETPKADLNITAEAKSRLLKLDSFANQDPKDWSVKVVTKNKVLYVTGEVNSDDTRDQILEALESIPHAEDIEADLQVQ